MVEQGLVLLEDKVGNYAVHGKRKHGSSVGAARDAFTRRMLTMMVQRIAIVILSERRKSLMRRKKIRMRVGSKRLAIVVGNVVGRSHSTRIVSGRSPSQESGRREYKRRATVER